MKRVSLILVAAFAVWTLVLGAWISLNCRTSQPQSAIEYDSPSRFAQALQTLPELPEVELPVPAQAQENSDPYEGWQTWCEPVVNDIECSSNADCQDIEYGEIGRPLRCIKPWWAKSSELKICAPGYARASERKWRKQRLREIVRQQYFDETKHCVLDGRPIREESWRCQRECKRAETLTNFLWLVYKRETTARPWKRHRLNPDRGANMKAWVRRAHDYGWQVQLGCTNGKKKCTSKLKYVRDYQPLADVPTNPHYASMHRWQYGLGGLGQNAALWTDTWDSMAPPEILCREVVAFETYLRRARDVVGMLVSGIDCDGDGDREYVNSSPTWVDVHRATSGGKVCPPKSQRDYRGTHGKNFRRRAAREGLDPDQVVTRTMLGKPIERETQNERLAQINAVLEMKLPHP